LARAAADTVSTLTAELLGKDPGVTSVAVDFVAPTLWFVAGRSVAEHRRPTFFVEVRITDGTNDKDDKARHAAAVYAALDRLLGGVHPESYVHIIDARADSYGFGGVTSERRYIESR